MRNHHSGPLLCSLDPKRTIHSSIAAEAGRGWTLLPCPQLKVAAPSHQLVVGTSQAVED